MVVVGTGVGCALVLLGIKNGADGTDVTVFSSPMSCKASDGREIVELIIADGLVVRGLWGNGNVLGINGGACS